MFLRKAKTALLTDWRSLMANVAFTLKELEDLAGKLQALQPFNEKEHALLLAIFRASIVLAKGSGTRVGAEESRPPVAILIQAPEAADRPATLTELKRQLGNSYTAGGDIDSVTIDDTTFYRIYPPSPPPPLPPSQ
jgi:hypothetical protein